MANEFEDRREKVILAGCHLSKRNAERFAHSMEELKALTQTAQGEPVTVVVQKRERIHPAFFVGKGKVEEIAELVEEHEVDTVIFNGELSAGQAGNLTALIGVKVIDRTQLILDIFAERARSREGKLQVELAQMKYMLPRLSGKGTSLSRLGGGIGTRGPGETKLEQDRRYIRRRITDIEKQLAAIVHHRERYRQRRRRNQSYQISLVGYTNAGKSTLFNKLTDAETMQENRLFATLDPLTRKFQLLSGFELLVSDTVGFIQDLPTALVAAFRSTLEEVKEADLILHVIDAANPDFEQHSETVLRLLKELGADEIPILTVYNKTDLIKQHFIAPPGEKSVSISAFVENDVDRLKQEIEKMMKEGMTFFQAKIPLSEGKLLAQLETGAFLEKEEWMEEEDSVRVKGYMSKDLPLYAELKTYF